MKHYKYNINIRGSKVTCEVCYPVQIKGLLSQKLADTDIFSCSKDFKKGFWSRATAPTEQQLKDAKEWGEQQVMIMNIHQHKD